MNRFRSFDREIFVCVALIGVKSKYGSGWGTSPGLININNTQKNLCREHKYFIFIRFESIDRFTYCLCCYFNIFLVNPS